MELKDVILACKQEGALTERTEQLSQVIRAYRNLIHPARIVRENERVNKDGAVIAQALVNLIIDEVSTRKSIGYGYRAEQIVTKIESDISTSAILDHLLVDTNEREVRRLLLEVIPQRYLHFYSSNEPVNTALMSLGRCFRLIYEKAADDIKREVAKAFIKIIKEEDQAVVYIYETVFFRAGDLEYFTSEDMQLVKQHLFSSLSIRIQSSLLEAMVGIGRFLTPKDVSPFIDPLIKSLTSKLVDAPVERCRLFLVGEYGFTSRDIDAVIIKHLEEWKAVFDLRENQESKDIVQELLDFWSTPPLIF